MFSGSSTTTSDHGGNTVFTSLHADIIQTHILTRLDGPALVSTSCGSSQLHHLCKEESLWKKICCSNWPAISHPRIQEIISTFPSGHRAFFSDSYPALDHQLHDLLSQGHSSRNSNSSRQRELRTPELISAVDIHYGNQLIYSKVIVTETLTGWFMSSPLRLDLLDMKEIVPTPVKFDGEEASCMTHMEENMKLSWIIIDPTTKRAVNLSSQRPVQVRRHWLTGEIQLQYATVLAAEVIGEFVNCGVMVTCDGEEGGDLHVREISLQVEDMAGKILSGKDSLVILQEAMEMNRRKRKIGEDKRRHEMFLEMRSIWREKRRKRESELDLVCIAIGVSIFLAFWMFILFG